MREVRITTEVAIRELYRYADDGTLGDVRYRDATVDDMLMAGWIQAEPQSNEVTPSNG